VDNERAFPVIRQTVLDTTDPRRLAEFYRQLFGLRYRPGDEPPGAGQPDPNGQDWLVLKSPAGGAALAFQKVRELPEARWPDGPVPQQLHLDTTVPTAADLDVQHERALALGARLLQDRSDDPEEPLRVYADPAGHPFCIFVGGVTRLIGWSRMPLWSTVVVSTQWIHSRSRLRYQRTATVPRHATARMAQTAITAAVTALL
jgi:hypothetical protein